MHNCCGLIKDLKTRYYICRTLKHKTCCGLIKDLKTRYWRCLYRLTIKKLSCYLQIKNASFL